MRIHRTLSGLLVTALLGVAPVATASSANAAEAGLVERAAVAQVKGDKPKRDVTAKIIETRRNKLVLKGKVSPDYQKKPVLIQKRNCLKPKCSWYKSARVTTDNKGRYSSRVTAPRQRYDYWRAKVEARGDYGTSYSGVWRTYTI